MAQYNFPELANEIEVEEAPVYKTIIDSPVNKVSIDSSVKSLNKPLGIAQMGSNEALAPLPSKSLPTKVLPAVQLDSIKKEVTTTVQTTQIAQVKIDTVIKQPKYNYPEGRFRINQVPVLLGKENMSFLEIAFKYNVPLYKIFEYNEIDKSNLLEKDQLIFLAPKKKVGATSFHIVKYNTSLHEISQLEGVQLSALKMYNPQLTDPIKEGTQVLLFKQKDNSPMIKKDNSLLFNKRKK